MNRRWVTAAALLLFAAGIAFILRPARAPAFSQPLVYGVGVLALFQALRSVRSRWNAGVRWAETPDVELPTAIRSPGEDLSDVLTQFTGTERVAGRTSIREGLRAAAVAVLRRYRGLTEDAAEELVDGGAWTDDEDAATFFSNPDRGGQPFASRIRNVLVGESGFSRELQSVTAAIADIADQPPPEEEPDLPPVPRAVEGLSEAGFETRPTGRWQGMSALALAGVGAGVLARQPSIVLLGVLGVGLAAYARSGSPTDPSLEVSRDLDADDIEPGDEVPVAVTVRNTGDRFLPDLRVVDGVPGTLEVTEGTPRLATPLRSGEAATFSYVLEARRGVHEFDPAVVVSRDLPGSRETVGRVAAATTLTCIPSLSPVPVPVPLRDRVTQYAGEVATESGGEGTEFYAVREYRPGDPMNRIDWNRLARTGQFSTIEFREERAATVVLVVDARAMAYVAPTPAPPHAVDRSVEAAGSILTTLLNGGNRVGLAALAPTDCWLAPDASREQRARARELLATHEAFSPEPPDADFTPSAWTERLLRRRLSADAQVYFLSPLVDGYAAFLARRLHAYGHAVTVVSPDPIPARTPTQRLARVGRALRITDLRESGVRVVDWPPDEPLAVALSRSARGWSG